jgi:hypothetical protein
MWLGSFALMMYGITESQKHLASLLAPVQKKIFEKGLDVPLTKMLPRILALVFCEASPQKSLYSGLALRNLRVLAIRPSVLLMCLSTLGAWLMVLLGMLFLSLNGLFLLGLGAILLFGLSADAGRAEGQRPVAEAVARTLRLLFAAGLFLLGGELVMRQGRVLPMMLGESDFAFFLADGRFGAVLGILVAAFLISLIIEIEFWSVAISLSLLLGGVISINGALGLVAGERMARAVLFYLRSRSLNDTCQRIGKGFGISSVIGALLGLFAAGFLRESLVWVYSSEGDILQDKIVIFVALWVAILAVQFLAQMIWGHFGGAYKESELQDARYFSSAWVSRELISVASLRWAHAKIHTRLSEIKYHLQGLGTIKEGQVPEVIQARLKTEEAELAKLLHDVLPRLG